MDVYNSPYESTVAEDMDVMDVASLPRWSQTLPMKPGHLVFAGMEKTHHEPPFAYNPELNKKIVLWGDDITTLTVHAIVHPTNESFSDHTPLSRHILMQAGPALKEELLVNVRYCRTGEAKITPAYDLPCRYVIHTVGPRYNPRYRTAAETALYSCYRHVLELVRENSLQSVAIPVLHTVRRCYPPDEGAHLALRTIRRFLEKHGDGIETVVLILDKNNRGIYDLLLPLYFPRSSNEAKYACYHLPADIGNENGEPVVSDRQIRIIDNPQHAYEASLEESQDLAAQWGSSVAIGNTAFAHMEDDIDRQKLLGQNTRASPDTVIDTLTLQAQHHERYERLLRRAKTEDLSDVSGIGCLYQSGVDKLGRPVIVFVGKWFNFNQVDLERALLYLIYLLDPLVKGDYIILYFHTLTAGENHASMSWMREVYNVLEYKYKKNLKGFYIIHPTFWTKIMTWWFLTFAAPAIKDKVHNIPGIEYLYSVVDMDQLEIPAFITEYDMTINGVRYCRPDSGEL